MSGLPNLTPAPPEELRVGYTRGRKLHAIYIRQGRKSGRLLCTNTTPGWRHPDFDDPNVSVPMSLSFNGGCKRCLRVLDTPNLSPSE